jgi:PAS domain S-box-containing protein
MTEEFSAMKKRIENLEESLSRSHKTEQALEESERKYRELVENAKSAIVKLDTEGRILFINEYAEQLFEYTKEELTGKPAIGTIVPAMDSDGRDLKKMVGIFTTKTGEHYETRNENENITKSGQRLWMSWNNRPVLDEHGRLVGLISIGQDITARKQAEEKQKKLRDNLQAMWDIAQLADEDIKALCDRVLIEIVKQTGSQYGFYGFIPPDESEMVLHSWSRETMKDCSVLVKPIHYPMEKAGIWGDAVRKRKPVTINDYESDFPGKGGLPDGHVSLTRLISVPVFSGEKIVALGAVANKNTLYSDEDVELIGAFMTNIQFVIDRKKAREKLQASLDEKEVLLKEIHHRVKNNLAVVTSLLNLQSSGIDDPEAKEAFKNSMSRIRAMALIHEKLYKSEDLRQIYASDYLEAIVENLVLNYRTLGSDIDVERKLDDIPLTIEQAIPCGLIMNELITNAFKYAFPGQAKGHITVTFAQQDDHSYKLAISDNGVGLPADISFPPPSSTPSLGLQLVEVLARQLDGRVRLKRSNGTQFNIIFPIRNS